MKIGIDCRMFGLKHAGIGRYVENVVGEILKQDSQNQYVLFTRKNFDVSLLPSVKNKPKIVEADFSHYSLKEQLFFPAVLKKEKLDLVHFPHFNIPIFYQGKFIVTIHDLIKHTSRGMATTTRSPLLYWLKFFCYKLVFRQAVRKATVILTPSNFVKKEIVGVYKIQPEKIEVTYEGVDEKITSNKSFHNSSKTKQGLNKYKSKQYLLYVGSVYPHKNVERLIQAVSLLREKDKDIKLVIVCGRSIFWERLKEKIKKLIAEELVVLTGFIPDEQLYFLYKDAEAFVFPTLSEGFGLPGLEAMAAGCPVICSDIGVLKEVYGQAAEYFNPCDPKDMAAKIKEVISDSKKKEDLVKKGFEKVKLYSWKQTAYQTLQSYQSFNQ